jgi:hypothetical protein
LGILSGNPKEEPLHYGEVFDLWASSVKAKGCISVYSAYQYHAGDKDLKKLLTDLVNQAKSEAKDCDKILIENGIGAPPYLPERPEAKLEDIPLGARLSDQEIAALAGADTSASMVMCSQVMGKCIREDIGALFGKFHISKTAMGLRILEMSKEKGWLVPPPLQAKPKELVEA